jgi:hypothetical protein
MIAFERSIGSLSLKASMLICNGKRVSYQRLKVKDKCKAVMREHSAHAMDVGCSRSLVHRALLTRPLATLKICELGYLNRPHTFLFHLKPTSYAASVTPIRESQLLCHSKAQMLLQSTLPSVIEHPC